LVYASIGSSAKIPEAVVTPFNAWNDPNDVKDAVKASHARKHDPGRVDVSDAYEVRRWCQQFLCTESMLRRAVDAVGDCPAEVEAALRRLR